MFFFWLIEYLIFSTDCLPQPSKDSIFLKSSLKISCGNFNNFNVSNQIVDSLYENTFSALGLLSNISQYLDCNPLIKEIYIYGAGEILDLFSSYLHKREISIIALIDKNKMVKKIDGIIYNTKLLEEVKFANKSNLVVVSSIAFAAEITENIYNFSSESGKNIKVINFYNTLLAE